MKNTKECGVTGKLRFTAEEADNEIAKMRKADVAKWSCRVCHAFHLVIRRRRKHNDVERSNG